MDKFAEKKEEFSFRLLRKEDLRPLWRPELEIIFVLKGSGRIYFTDVKTEYTVHETDLFVINCFEMHNFELEGEALVLSLTVAVEFLMSVSPDFLKYQVNCRSFLHGEEAQELFDTLRSDFAWAFEEQYKNTDQARGYFKSRTVAVLENLSRYFLDRSRPVESKRGFESLRAAVNYIQEHYREPISLEDLAEETFLSRTYLSRCFTKYFGISFTDYVTMLRISDAAKRMHGEGTLAEIAYESGFPNVNAMIHAFKQHRGITPGEYRKRLWQGEGVIQTESERVEEEMREDFSSLMQYVQNETIVETAAERTIPVTVDVSGRKKRVSLHWKRVINAGYARSLTDSMVQRELRYLQKKVGFSYIRIKGILDDDMCLLRTDMNGNVVMNYVYVDEVIELIRSLGAEPMIEIGHMPGLLAKNALVRSMRAGILAAPKDIGSWRQLIESLMEHFVERFGRKVVKKWLFAPWVPLDMMGYGLCSEEEYEEVYVTSYSAIKNADPGFLVTGPGCADYSHYLERYITMCKRRQCMPDVFTFRSFGTVGETEKDELNLIKNNESFSMAVSGDENLLHNLAGEFRGFLRKEGLSELPLVLEEWSNNVWQRDLCNDTCYKSAYLFKNILENNQDLNAMGYFSLNDRLDEIPPAGDLFHGGFGLFTQNDIPKSACRAIELLGQMGDQLLARGDGYFITRRETEIQIYLYNYCHYDLLYRYRHVVNMSRTNRYQVFVPQEPKAFYIQLRHMEAGKYGIRRYGITREGGSSYDAWVKMGALESVNEEEKELLECLSHPLYRRETADVEGGEGILTVKASLNPLDVWLIKINIL